MNDNIAVDIVLLPSKEVMQKIIALIDYAPSSPFRLGTANTFPHISLAMGVLKKKDLSIANTVLAGLAADHASISVTAHSINTFDTPDGKPFNELTVDATPDLIKLHGDVMEAFKPLLIHENVETSMFASPPAVAEISTHWVSHYYDKLTPEDFHPHFTLGEGNTNKLEAMPEFTVNRLALCHLGTYCTCKNILAEERLL